MPVKQRHRPRCPLCMSPRGFTQELPRSQEAATPRYVENAYKGKWAVQPEATRASMVITCGREPLHGHLTGLPRRVKLRATARLIFPSKAGTHADCVPRRSCTAHPPDDSSQYDQTFERLSTALSRQRCRFAAILPCGTGGGDSATYELFPARVNAYPTMDGPWCRASNGVPTIVSLLHKGSIPVCNDKRNFDD